MSKIEIACSGRWYRSVVRALVLVLLLPSLALAADEPPRVIVSIKPVHSLVARLMDGIAKPELIVGGSETPYTYELKPPQRAALEQADLVIWVGPELERFLEAPLAELGERTRVVELLDSDELKILPADDGSDRRDPFFWLDSRNALILIDELARALVAADPGRAGLYRENHARAVKEISAVDRELEYRYRDVSASPFALYHGTQQYFAQAYAASPTAVAAVNPARPPETAALLKARAAIVERAVPCLLVEAGLPTPNLGLLTQGAGVQVAELDSLGTRLEPGPELYVKLMHGNFAAIRDCVAGAGGLPEIRPSGHRDLAPVDIPPGELTGRFLLENHLSEPVTNLDYLGEFLLIAFGYTGCPDVCPTSLSVMSAAMERLGEKSERIRPIFITVDPERDNEAVLRQYVSFFHPRLVGLTGTREMIDRVVHDFGVRYEKVPAEDGDYTINHTAGYFLFGPNGVFLEKLAHGLTAQQLADKLDRYLR